MNGSDYEARTRRELEALQRQMIVRRATGGYLLPHERRWHTVWRDARWVELGGAVAAAMWLLWLCA